MKTIPLTKGQVAMVDDDDYESLACWRWHTCNGGNGKLYAARRIARREILLMHRAIASQTNALDVDHKNGNGLDNQRLNLRECTRRQNQCNRKTPSHNKSGFKGVDWCSRRAGGGKWRASIRSDDRSRHLGYFDTKLAAAITYNIAAVQLHGEFARLNDVFSGDVTL